MIIFEMVFSVFFGGTKKVAQENKGILISLSLESCWASQKKLGNLSSYFELAFFDFEYWFHFRNFQIPNL